MNTLLRTGKVLGSIAFWLGALFILVVAFLVWDDRTDPGRQAIRAQFATEQGR